MTLRTRLLRILAILILTPVIFLLGCQSTLIYHPSPYRESHQQMLRAARGGRLEYQTSQGKQTAFYIPPRAGDAATAPLWVCFAGNASLALDWLHMTGGWDDRFAFLLVDYPSYGDCEGTPTPARIRQSAGAAFETLASRLKTTPEVLVKRSFVLGHSLGAAAALMAVEDLGLKRGMLISPFTSMTDMGRIVLGWPLCHLNMHRFDNRKTLGRVAAREGIRFTIFHGGADEVIPVRMGQELAASHPAAVTFHEVSGAHHNDIFAFAGERIGREMQKLVFPQPDQGKRLK